MALLIKIFDFDLTLTKRHTFSKKSRYSAQSNIKNGLSEFIAHNDDTIIAIATFHSDVNYVLSYLLHILHKGDSNRIIGIEEIPFDKYHLAKFYFKDIKHPIIISYVPEHMPDDYRKDGKNNMLLSVVKQLPKAQAYHFYDDDPENIRLANELKFISTHIVSRSSPQDFILTSGTSDQAASYALLKSLKDYKNKRNASDYEYSGWGSYLSFNFFGYSKSAKCAAVDALIASLDSGEPVATRHFGALRDGTLARTINNWRLLYKRDWPELIAAKKISHPSP